MEHTKLPWEANKFTKLDGSEIKTVADVVECLKSSAELAGGLELYGVAPKGRDDIIICYTGNGETSKANAAFIVKACNSHYDLLEACKRGCNTLAIAIKSAWEDSTDEDVAEHHVIKQMNAAIAKAE